MRIRALVVAVLCCGLVCQGRAQTPASAVPAGVDDGIRAFVAGDYARAARILRPAAETDQPPDPVAQFFVGFLYYSNLGVPGDRFRACSLFQQAAAIANPFAATAARMARGIEELTSRQFSCEQLSTPAPPLPVIDSNRVVADVAATLNVPGGSVADAVVAFAHADYPRAVEILKPMTEKSVMPDQVAAFFMAILYDAGLGVPMDAVRACAHYQQAGMPVAGREQPFSQAAMFVLGPMFPTNQVAMDSCMRMAVFGFDAGLEPIAFQLGQGHSIEWDAKGATVWYHGTSKAFAFDLQPLGGGRSFPIQYIPLDTGPHRSDRRHFIEFAFWQHGAPTARWHLQWFLFEVVREDVLTIAGEEVAASNSDEVPAADGSELRKYVRLGVNDDGDAEWALLSGPDQSAHVIDTEADREMDRVTQETRRALDAARIAASKRGATAETRDLNRAPSFTYMAGDTEGCGMIGIAGWSADHTEEIVLASVTDQPPVGAFDLASVTTIRVDVHVYNQPAANPFCTDFRHLVDGEEDRVWHARSGGVTIALARPSAPHRREQTATVTIRDAVFVSPSGQTITLSRPLVFTAVVGALMAG